MIRLIVCLLLVSSALAQNFHSDVNQFRAQSVDRLLNIYQQLPVEERIHLRLKFYLATEDSTILAEFLDSVQPMYDFDDNQYPSLYYHEGDPSRFEIAVPTDTLSGQLIDQPPNILDLKTWEHLPPAWISAYQLSKKRELTEVIRDVCYFNLSFCTNNGLPILRPKYSVRDSLETDASDFDRVRLVQYPGYIAGELVTMLWAAKILNDKHLAQEAFLCLSALDYLRYETESRLWSRHYLATGEFHHQQYAWDDSGCLPLRAFKVAYDLYGAERHLHTVKEVCDINIQMFWDKERGYFRSIGLVDIEEQTDSTTSLFFPADQSRGWETLCWLTEQTGDSSYALYALKEIQTIIKAARTNALTHDDGLMYQNSYYWDDAFGLVDEEVDYRLGHTEWWSGLAYVIRFLRENDTSEFESYQQEIFEFTQDLFDDTVKIMEEDGPNVRMISQMLNITLAGNYEDWTSAMENGGVLLR